MAGFRLRDEFDIDGLLVRLTQAALDEIKREQPSASPELQKNQDFRG
ncbi:hypothetical protein HYR54_14055 [Candidatus Acetothermia bacterium]|nr:hypothetical protein [Candidatus Acetothermia bacterium]MBI3461185.1 hypothetical protein [Candidatus Acetothermia bacterium]